METIAIGTLYAATFVNAAMPGPCAILAASRTARYGVRSGLGVSAGVVAGVTVLTGLSFGVLHGALTVSSAILVAMKWTGVIALLAFSVRALRSASSSLGLRTQGQTKVRNDLVAGAIIVLSSPSVLIFLLALLPQFVPANAADLGPAMIAASVFIVGIAAAQAGGIVFGACSLRLGSARTRWVDQVGAVLLIGFAGAAVFTPVG